MSATVQGGFFVTGTDTGVGKTVVSQALVRALRQRGRRVAVMKPVASGCRDHAGKLLNDDALALQALSSLRQDYDSINPYAFEAPVAPHLAAASSGTAIEIDRIVGQAQRLQRDCDCLVVEGVGGWQVPLGEQFALPDLVQALGLPVILVVGIRLGCLNHALMTRQLIEQRGLEVYAWVANCLDDGMLMIDETISDLETRWQQSPALVVPWLETIDIESLAADWVLDD
jgi:dethiobiotin synthetase